MEIEMYCFSGTGNSLHAARELQRRLPGARLTALTAEIRRGRFKTSADVVGFVFPNFCLTIPIPLHEFLTKADLSSAKYLFGLCTRGGSQSQAFDYMDDILRKQGRRLNARLELNMPWNHPVLENLPAMNSKEKMRQQEAVLQTELDRFSRHILASEDCLADNGKGDYDLTMGMKVFDILVSKNFNYVSHRYMYQKLVHFYADEQCSGCGICEKVCPSFKISLDEGRPVWQKDVKCYACFACINFCPRQAIQVQSKFPIQSNTGVNDRYHHPSVSYIDIAAQRG